MTLHYRLVCSASSVRLHSIHSRHRQAEQLRTSDSAQRSALPAVGAAPAPKSVRITKASLLGVFGSGRQEKKPRLTRHSRASRPSGWIHRVLKACSGAGGGSIDEVPLPPLGTGSHQDTCIERLRVIPLLFVGV